MVFYCHTKKRYLSLWYSTVTQRHGTCPCGALLSHKDTVPVPAVFYCHTKTRYLSLWCSTVTQKHVTSHCCALLSHTCTVPVPFVICHPETQLQSPRYFPVNLRHSYSPRATLMSQEAQNQSLRYSTITHTHGICTRVTTLSPIDRVPAPVKLYCLTKTRKQFLR